MSSPNWTSEQLDAIVARDCSLLVSAAAGSGKTAVLVERIIQRVSDAAKGVDVDRLLVVTFTKAAAAEMRERINAAIIKKLNQNPGSHHLNRQLTLLNRASITTLHSFCLDILKQYFYRIELDPGFRVSEDTEATLLRLEVLEDLFEDLYTEGNAEFLNLVDAYGGDRDDLYLQDMVLKLYEFSRSTPWPKEWLQRLEADYSPTGGGPLEKTAWGREILASLKLSLDGCSQKLIKAIGLSQSPGGPEVYGENLAEDLRLIDDLKRAACISWQELHEVINSTGFGKLKTCRSKDVDETLKKQVQSIRDTVKKTVNTMRDDLFLRTQQELADDLSRVRPLVKALVDLVFEFDLKYKKAKTGRGLVDFSDLEHYCLQILLEDGSCPGKLIPSAVAAELKDYFAEVFVDEYQDINEVQETILRLISRDKDNNPNMFMVGDVKQSIYGFRLAEPGLFMQKYREFPRENGLPERGIDLTQNFRSRSEVLQAVNFIFRQIMTPGVGELTYDDKAELVCGAGYPQVTEGVISAAGPVELHLLDKTQADEDELIRENGYSDGIEPEETGENAGNDLEELDGLQREARFIGQRIIEMVRGTKEHPVPEFSVHDRKQGVYRPVQFRDIVVLLRTTRNASNIFLEEFRKLGIPAYADLGTGYFEAVEVETIMSLLKILDNPRQDIPLAAVLRSPVVGLNADELAAVRLRDSQGQFYDAVRKSAELGETPVDLKLRLLLTRLEKWRTGARQGPLSELIWQLYNETNYYTYVGGMPGGAQRQANLRALYDRARQYEATSFRGLFRFLRFIEKFRESGSDLGAARSLGEKEDVVRVISIHKSKGLEFPVVITAGLGKQFNFSDLRQKFLLHKKLGLGLPVVDTNNCLTYQTIAQNAIKKRMLMELLAEEMRVLYVALTRAKEKLILVGSVREMDKVARKWCDSVDINTWNLPDYILAEATNFLGWIGPVIARHNDGALLRKTAGCELKPAPAVAGDQAQFTVQIHRPGDMPTTFNDDASESSGFMERVRCLEPVEVDASLRFEDRFNWSYLNNTVVGRPAKASVSDLKRRFDRDSSEEQGLNMTSRPSVARRPDFLKHSSVLSPAERGSAMHLAMQHLDFSRDLTEEEIDEHLRLMVSKELLTLQQYQAIDRKAVRNFFLSPIGQIARLAKSVKKELPFTMAVPAQRIYQGVDGETNDYVLIQGVIDCLIDQEDGFILVDYKTDGGSIEEIKNRYTSQLKLYEEAVERILRKPVRQKYLYLFTHGVAVELD